MPTQPTGTHHLLPFGNLSPDDFERMCLWLIQREGYERINDYSARGGPDGGRDFEGWRDGRRVLFQCKRTESFSAADAKDEIKKAAALPRDQHPDEICFLLSKDPTPATIDAAKSAWWGEDSTCWFLSGRQLDQRIRAYPEILKTFFELVPGSTSYSVRISGDAFQSAIIVGDGNTVVYQNERTRTASDQYRCQAPHPGSGFVHRDELNIMAERLSSPAGDSADASTLAITTALQGAGGFGKTTLAQALCHHPKVRDAFPDGILWIQMKESLDDTGRKKAILEAVRWWAVDDPPAFETAQGAGDHLRTLLGGRRTLVVVDDVWHRGDLRPLGDIGGGSALLITTRNRNTLPQTTLSLDVDEMQLDEAVQLLGAGIDGQPEAFESLAGQLGEWPLLLKLVNGQVRKLTGRGALVSEALERIAEKLRRKGLTAFDHRDTEAREDAVRLTMAAGFESGVLDESDQARYRSLAIFPEDTDIPIEILAPYWALHPDDTQELSERLFDLSLLQRLDPGPPQTIRLHDVFRHYLIDEQRSQLPELNQQFLEAHRPESGRWSDLPPSAGYLWRHLADHLLDAEEASCLADLLVDPDYLETKIKVTDVNALLADFKEPAADQDRLLVADAIRKSEHCLNQDPQQLAGQLLGRIAEEGRSIFQQLAQSLRDRSGLLPRRGSLRPAGGPLQRTLEGHTGGVLAVERLEGGRLVSASEDRTLWVWDVDSGARLHRLEGHTARVLAVERLEGGRLVSASEDATLRVWDVDSGACLHRLEGHTGWIQAVERLEDGRLVSASEDRTLRVWDVDSGARLHTLEGHTAPVVAVERLEDGRLVSASEDRTLRVWDVDSGACLHTLEGHTAPVVAMERLEGGRLVSASGDHTLRVWDVDSGTCLQSLEGHTGWIQAVGRLEGGRLVSASEDRTLRVWDVDSGTCLHTLEGHTGWVVAVERLEDGRLVSASRDRTLRVWDVDSGACLHTLEGHTGWVVAVEWLDHGRLVSASWDHTLRVWDVDSGTCLQSLESHTGGVDAVERLDYGRLISASWDHTLRVWDVDSGARLHTLEGHTAPVVAVERLDHGRLVSASEDRTLRVWDVDSGACLHTLEGHTAPVVAVERLDHGRLISASWDTTLRVWDVDSGTCLHTLEGHTFWVDAVERLEGGRLVSASEDAALRVWDVDSGTCLHTLEGHTDGVNAVERLDHSRLVSASKDATLRVWDVDSGTCLHTLEGHTDGVNAVERLDHRRLVSASEDATLRVWDVDSGTCLHRLEGHTGGVNAVERLDHGRLVSASWDHMLRVWDVDSGKTIAVFTGDGSVSAIKVISPKLIVAGDKAGRVHILDLIEPDLPDKP